MSSVLLSLVRKSPPDHSSLLQVENGSVLPSEDGNQSLMFQNLSIRQLWDNGQSMPMLPTKSKDLIRSMMPSTLYTTNTASEP